MCSTNTFFNIMDTSDRILKRDKFVKEKCYHPKWYEIVSDQTRSLLFFSIITVILILFIIY